MRRWMAIALLAATAGGFRLAGQQEANMEPARISVPGAWEGQLNGRYDGLDGYAWYACRVHIPQDWRQPGLELRIENVDNVHEAFVNGESVGSAGSFPPDYRNGIEETQSYPVSESLSAKPDGLLISVRVYDEGGRGGFKGSTPAVVFDNRAIPMQGEWAFHPGDLTTPNEYFQQAGSRLPSYSEIVDIEIMNFNQDTFSRATLEEQNPLPPEESLRRFETFDDLDIELVLSEPDVAQPVFLNFDERGRMWVVEYRQYPDPAGLKRISRDTYWRSVYDKTPPPPPNHFPGKDRISIHEDADGDGTFESHKVFVDGLNLATSVAQGRGGVWVLNPPYLLFYPDLNRDDVPDSDPIVHLSGFGLEDTHSIANSLRWGPDGWLYAAQGSTVTGNIVRPGIDGEPRFSQGQLIWRYHPETRRYEIFAEGGGNAFGVEIDSKGRIFSGHNGGNTRGFHYVQGAYLRKGFTKHGPLSNPYAFGYFPAMKHNDVERFTHNFIIYEDRALPERYWGKLFGIEPLQGRVVVAEFFTDGSSFQSRDIGRAVKTDDAWFRPVDIKAGPDGCVYIADWYDQQVNHFRNHEGFIDKSNGRVYRIQPKDFRSLELESLAGLSSEQLVERLSHPIRWVRQTALRLLGDRRDASLAAGLSQRLKSESKPASLETLWALNLCGGFNETIAGDLLFHPNEFIRLWTVRLLCDRESVSRETLDALVRLAAEEPNAEVRNQLACSAKRLPSEETLRVIEPLMKRDEDASDVYIPLLVWWALESAANAERPRVISLFQNRELWNVPLVRRHILHRLMKRYALAGSRQDLNACAELLRAAPSSEHARILIGAFEEAYQGRPMAGLPDALLEALEKFGGQSLSIRLKRREPEAVGEAIGLIAEKQSDPAAVAGTVRILGEIQAREALPGLLELARSSDRSQVLLALFNALQSFDSPKIAHAVLERYSSLAPDILPAAQSLLASRESWALELLRNIDRGTINAGGIARDTVARLRLHDQPELNGLMDRYFPSGQDMDPETLRREIQRVHSALAAGNGSPYEGQKLYRMACSVCHKLFDEGGSVGPDLTAYQRQDLDSMLLNIIHPNAEIREGYENLLVETKDDRVVSGFMEEKDNQILVLRGVDGQKTLLPQDQIREIRSAQVSLMPEGLLSAFNDQQLRDLFAYLRSTQPLNN